MSGQAEQAEQDYWEWVLAQSGLAPLDLYFEDRSGVVSLEQEAAEEEQDNG